MTQSKSTQSLEQQLASDPHLAQRYAMYYPMNTAQPANLLSLGIVTPHELELFRKIDAQPELSAKVLEHQTELWEANQRTPRLLPWDGVHHMSPGEALSKILEHGTANIVGAFGAWLAVQIYPDDPEKQVAFSGLYAAAGDVGLAAGGSIADRQEHRERTAADHHPTVDPAPRPYGHGTEELRDKLPDTTPVAEGAEPQTFAPPDDRLIHNGPEIHPGSDGTGGSDGNSGQSIPPETPSTGDNQSVIETNYSPDQPIYETASGEWLQLNDIQSTANDVMTHGGEITDTSGRWSSAVYDPSHDAPDQNSHLTPGAPYTDSNGLSHAGGYDPGLDNSTSSAHSGVDHLDPPPAVPSDPHTTEAGNVVDLSGSINTFEVSNLPPEPGLHGNQLHPGQGSYDPTHDQLADDRSHGPSSFDPAHDPSGFDSAHDPSSYDPSHDPSTAPDQSFDPSSYDAHGHDGSSWDGSAMTAAGANFSLDSGQQVHAEYNAASDAHDPATAEASYAAP